MEGPGGKQEGGRRQGVSMHTSKRSEEEVQGEKKFGREIRTFKESPFRSKKTALKVAQQRTLNADASHEEKRGKESQKKTFAVLRLLRSREKKRG